MFHIELSVEKALKEPQSKSFFPATFIFKFLAYIDSTQLIELRFWYTEFAPWKKSYDQPRQHIKKQRHYFANKGPSRQSYGFPVVMYGCESWTIKKAERQRIDAFELWCWRRLWEFLGLQDQTSQSERKSVLNIHWKDWCWSWNSNIWPPDVKNWLLGKDSDAGKDWRQKEMGMTED